MYNYTAIHGRLFFYSWSHNQLFLVKFAYQRLPTSKLILMIEEYIEINRRKNKNFKTIIIQIEIKC